MHIVRTIIWVLLLAALLIFSIANWDPTVTVRIWPGLLLDTKIPAIVILSLLAGFVPMWLYLRAEKWRLKRRIHNLENAARTAATVPVAAPPEPRFEPRPEPRFAPDPEPEPEVVAAPIDTHHPLAIPPEPASPPPPPFEPEPGEIPATNRPPRA